MRWLLLLAVLVGCGDMGEQTLIVKARGLYLTANSLDAPPGSLSRADNVVIRRPNVVEPRRGQKPDTQVDAGVAEMTAFEGDVVAHLDDGELVVRDGPGSFIGIGGTYTAPTGHPVRFAEAGGGLYFTTSTGPQRLDTLTSTPVPAGTPPGLEGKAELSGTFGWLNGGAPATGTVTLGGGAGDVTVVINGTSVGPVAFSVDDATTAANTVTAINANGTLAPLVTASNVGVVITITTDTGGDTVNYSLSASRTAGTATASGSTLVGGTSGGTTGYRLVWGSRDGDGALLLGAPSGRFTVSNNAGANRNVLVTAPIPSGIVAGTHFLQIYRTVIVATGGNDPGEDMAQVAEVFPNPDEITAGVMSYADTSSFANGPTAYFSPSSGPGLADSHEQPPLLTDAIQFKGYLFGVVQSYRQTLPISLLGVSAPDGLANGDGLSIGTRGYLASSTDPEGTSVGGLRTFVLALAGTAAQNIEDTARSLVRVINLYPGDVYAAYVSGPGDIPGKILLTARDLTDPLPVGAIANPAAWTPRLKIYFGAALTRLAGVVTGTTPIPHHLRVGDQVVLLPGVISPAFPAGTKTVATTPTSTTFTYVEAGSNASSAGEEPFSTAEDDVYMTQEAVPGSWATSVFQQPDSWPPRFRYQVGGPNTRLDRITAQGDALLFWTSDGLYRLTGETEDDFTLRPLDPTIQLVGQNTPTNIGNKGFALTTQGVVSVTDLGVEKISTPLDEALLPYYGSTDASRALVDAHAFGVPYQSENEYMLFLPNLTGSPTAAQYAYVFNTQTGTWAEQSWEWDGINEGTGYVKAGVVNPADNYLYLGAADWITRERKDRALSDYQDADGAGIPMDVAYQVETAKNPGALKQWSEVTALLERPQPASMEFYCSTEIDTSEEGGTIASEGNSNLRTYLPINKSRSARLTLGFRHDAPLEKPTILGLSVVYNTNSTRVGR